MKNILRITLVSMLLSSVFLISGCYTLQGAGKDVQSVGKHVERAFN